MTRPNPDRGSSTAIGRLASAPGSEIDRLIRDQGQAGGGLVGVVPVGLVPSADESGEGRGEATADGRPIRGIGLEEVDLGAIEQAVGWGRGETSTPGEMFGKGPVATVGRQE
jgi:hypothetical protein